LLLITVLLLTMVPAAIAASSDFEFITTIQSSYYGTLRPKPGYYAGSKKYTAGTEVEILEEINGGGSLWYKVRIIKDNNEGYLQNLYKDRASAPVIAIAVTNQKANMRKNASAKADVWEICPKGTIIEILGEVEADNELWYRVRIANCKVEGYMRDYLLDFMPYDSELDLYIARVKEEYAEDLQYISEESLIKLAKLKRDYTISMHFDGVGYYNDIFDTYKLPNEKINTAISYIYDTLQILGTDETTLAVIARSCNDVYNVVEGGNRNMVGSTRMLISYDDRYSNEYIVKAIIEELSDLICYNNGISLDKFRSYNGFDKYDTEGGTWLDEYKAMSFDNDYEVIKYYYSNGLLTNAGYTEVYDDMNDYFQGLVFNEANPVFDPIYGADFWKIYLWSKLYDLNQTVMKKTDWLIQQLNSINPLWTFEFFFNLSCPYDDYTVDGISAYENGE